MILELDKPTSHRWFATATMDNTNERDAPQRRDDTSAEVLAYEISRYMPELARLLADKGRRRLLAA
jgi:hypothetical protein